LTLLTLWALLLASINIAGQALPHPARSSLGAAHRTIQAPPTHLLGSEKCSLKIERFPESPHATCSFPYAGRGLGEL